MAVLTVIEELNLLPLSLPFAIVNPHWKQGCCNLPVPIAVGAPSSGRGSCHRASGSGRSGDRSRSCNGVCSGDRVCNGDGIGTSDSMRISDGVHDGDGGRSGCCSTPRTVAKTVSHDRWPDHHEPETHSVCWPVQPDSCTSVGFAPF